MSDRTISTAEYHRLVRSKWTEATFQAAIIREAHIRNWKVHHARAAQIRPGRYATPIQGNAGYPDLTLARGGQLIVAELKTETAMPTAQQREWLEILAGQRIAEWSRITLDGLYPGGIIRGHPRATITVALWRPRHWETILHYLG